MSDPGVVIAAVSVISAIVGANWKLQGTINANHQANQAKLVGLEIALTQHTAEEKGRDEKLGSIMDTVKDQEHRLRVVEMGESLAEFVKAANMLTKGHGAGR